MKKIRINFISTLVSVSMLALLVIQIFQILQLYDRKLNQFKVRTQNLVDRIAIHHEKTDDVRKYLQVVNRDFSGQYKDILKKEFQSLLSARESISIKDTVLLENGTRNAYLVIKGKAFDTVSGLTTEQRVMARDVRQLRQLFDKSSSVIRNNDSMNLSIQLDRRVMEQIFKKARFVNEIMLEAFRNNMYTAPSERIDLAFLDSVISYEVGHDRLPMNYEYLITDADGHPIKFKHPSKRYRLELDTTHMAKSTLFPQNVLDEKLYLSISFPTQARLIFHEMRSMLIMNGALLVLVMLSIVFMFRTILTQKKLSEMKNDFISNMTHEFKTPISTISLACEALNDKDVIKSETTEAQPFIKMIADENKRLEVLVERILQSAIIDRGELKLKMETLQLNEIVHEICDKARFRIESTGGMLDLTVPTEKVTVVGDRVHVTNIISNLVDNAIKYSRDKPKIEVSLRREGNKYYLAVKDEGIGIAKEHVDKIFDKLYRVPTGNVHNVKGFGLGLSYVKAIVERNKWHLNVKSKENEGSTFTLIIPVL